MERSLRSLDVARDDNKGARDDNKGARDDTPSVISNGVERRNDVGICRFKRGWGGRFD